jgi:hypothetical protein
MSQEENSSQGVGGNAPIETESGEFVPACRFSDGNIAAAAVLVEANNDKRAARANRPQNRRSGSVSFQAGAGESPRHGESPRPGDLTICQKLDALHCDDLARILKARMTKGVVGVDLASILNLASSELKLRPVQMDTASHVLWILSVFRDLSGGTNINPQLLEIRTHVGRCMKEGVWAEQLDPIAMLKQVAECSIAWDRYYDQHLPKSGGGGGVGNSGALVGGATLLVEESSKRPFPPSSEGQKGTTMQGITRQAFDPFVVFPDQCVAEKSDTCKKWFVRGQTRAKMDGLVKAGKCVLCKTAGHMLSACPTKGAMFASKKFCFHPVK